jgi:hypothetical protein
MFRRRALGDAVQDQNHLDTGVSTSMPHRVNEGLEDTLARCATIAEHWQPMPIMWLLAGSHRMPGGVLQTLRVQRLEQMVVAFLLIHQFLNREGYHRSAHSASGWCLFRFYQIAAI